ncbi:MAG: NlpC/P60 family protein [Pseudomonadota bacterium]
MTDRRFWRANGRVAHVDLGPMGGVSRQRPRMHSIASEVTDLCRLPGEGRDKQMLFGQSFAVLDVHEGFAFGYDPRDGYVGYVPETALATPFGATHRVGVPLAHVYAEPDFKSCDIHLLPLGSEVRVVGQDADFAALDGLGYTVSRHLAPADIPAADWVAVAERFADAPYLWGGNTATGMDCSGLVQMSMWAAGRVCPRDSDLQEAAFPAATGAARRGDLVFWKGHVGVMLDADALLHANAHHMAVTRESLAQAVERIGAREFGAVTKIARP